MGGANFRGSNPGAARQIKRAEENRSEVALEGLDRRRFADAVRTEENRMESVPGANPARGLSCDRSRADAVRGRGGVGQQLLPQRVHRLMNEMPVVIGDGFNDHACAARQQAVGLIVAAIRIGRVKARQPDGVIIRQIGLRQAIGQYAGKFQRRRGNPELSVLLAGLKKLIAAKKTRPAIV